MYCGDEHCTIFFKMQDRAYRACNKVLYRESHYSGKIEQNLLSALYLR